MKKIIIVIICAAVILVTAISITFATVNNDSVPSVTAPQKGDKGDPGEKGTDGLDGINGVDGINGIDGRDGINGQDGRDGLDGKDGKNGGESLYLHIYKIRLESYNLTYYNTDFLEFYLHMTFGFATPFQNFNSLRSFMGNSVLPFSGFAYLNGGFYDGLALFNIQTGTVYNPNMTAFPFDLNNIVSEEFTYHVVNMGG